MRYETEKPKPITAYAIANGVNSFGIKIVKKPRPAAAMNITLPTKPNDEALFNFAFCHIFPARASNVIAIIRIAQIIDFESSAPSRSRNKAGAIRRNSADKPKTTEPALSVLLIPC